MSTFKIPNADGQIRQDNTGETRGELTETFNIDLTTTPGKMRTSKKMRRVLTETTHIGTPTGIMDLLIWNDYYLLLTEDNTYRCLVANDPTIAANWSIVSAIGDLDLVTTAVVFNGELRLSLNTNVARWNGAGTYSASWWTATIGGAALTTSKPHILHVHRGGTETLFVTDNNLVRYYNAAAGHSTITLQDDLTACCLASGVSAVWAGTYNESSGNAIVYEMYVGEQIDGAPIARNAYEVEGRAVLAIWVKNNIPYIATERGNIQQFNGAGFVTVATFPFVKSGRPLKNVVPGLIQDSSISRPVHPRGVKTHNESTFILINTLSEIDEYAADTRSQSGVWELNYETMSLSHRFAIAESTTFGPAVLNSSGPLLIPDTPYTFAMAGTRANSAVGLFMTTNDQNQGYFITKEINSESVLDVFGSIYNKAKTLGATEKIVSLYRTSKRDTVYGAINWVSGTTFTTTADWSAVDVGDLVRVSHGYGAGDYANVVTITPSAATYEVVLDRSIGSAGQTSNLHSDNFKKIPTEYLTDSGEFIKLGVNAVSPWAQFMIVFLGAIEYREFICKSQVKNEV